MAKYLDEAGLKKYDELLKAYFNTALEDEVGQAVADLAGALQFKGLISSDTTMHTTYPNAEVGDVYFVSVDGVKLTYYDGAGTPHSAEAMEKGDAIICLKKGTGTQPATASHWGSLQVNWNVVNGTSDLAWGSEVTVGTVGGVDITAKLPAKNSIKPSDIGAATAAQGALANNALQGIKVNGSSAVPDADKVASIVSTTKIRIGSDNTTYYEPEQTGSGAVEGRVTLPAYPTKTSLGLGAAAEKGVASSVTTGGTNLPTAGAVATYVDNAVSTAVGSADHWHATDAITVSDNGESLVANLVGSTHTKGEVLRVPTYLTKPVEVTYTPVDNGGSPITVEANPGDVFVCVVDHNSGAGEDRFLHLPGGGRISDNFINSLFPEDDSN